MLNAPIGRVFPLFTPEGEKAWAEGWDPQYLYPSTGETVQGMVFATGDGDERTLWSLVDFDPAHHYVRYARVTPASRFGFVEVRCSANGDATDVTVTYIFTALNESGNEFIAGYSEENYREMIEGWRSDISAALRLVPPGSSRPEAGDH